LSSPGEDRVITFDGHRAFDRPVAVVHGGARLEVVACVSLYISTGVEPASPVRRGFEVRCAGGRRFRLILTEGVGWEIIPLPGPSAVKAP